MVTVAGVIMPARVVAIAALAAAALALAGCGSSAARPPATARTLPAPPASVPPDYTSVAALVRELDGVAICNPDGPQSELCSFVTAETNTTQVADVQPFEVKVFATPEATQAYLAYIHGVNETYRQDGNPEREALTGPHWVAFPQGEFPDLAARLQPYLGGTVTR